MYQITNQSPLRGQMNNSTTIIVVILIWNAFTTLRRVQVYPESGEPSRPHNLRYNSIFMLRGTCCSVYHIQHACCDKSFALNNTEGDVYLCRLCTAPTTESHHHGIFRVILFNLFLTP